MALQFTSGDLIADRWLVIRVHYREARRYIVQDDQTHEMTLCQVEPLEQVPLLFYNARIVNEMNDINLFCIPNYIKYDEYRQGGYRYLVTAPVGPTLGQLRELLPLCAKRRFSLGTCLYIGRMSLNSLREFHEAGYLHRDVKPESFSLRWTLPLSHLMLSTSRPRRWLDFDGQTPFPSRSRAPFRGNLQYASVNSLRQQEQTRFDDIWSWFYLLVDLTNRSLPWQHLGLGYNNYETIQALADTKELAHENVEWLQSAPCEYTEILAYLKSSSITDAPDYDRLYKLLSKAVDRVKEETDGEMKLDWEIGGQYYENLRQLL